MHIVDGILQGHADETTLYGTPGDEVNILRILIENELNGQLETQEFQTKQVQNNKIPQMNYKPIPLQTEGVIFEPLAEKPQTKPYKVEIKNLKKDLISTGHLKGPSSGPISIDSQQANIANKIKTINQEYDTLLMIESKSLNAR